MAAEPSDVTRLLQSWSRGDERALARLMPLVYGELRRIARGQMRGERGGHTLQTTAVVHEAFLRLVSADVTLQDRAHFFALAAGAMRRVLVDHARGRNRSKRGGGGERVELTDSLAAEPRPAVDLLDLDRALERLAARNPRCAELVELHYFGGIDYDEIARLKEVSRSTVNRELRFARVFLARELGRPLDG